MHAATSRRHQLESVALPLAAAAVLVASWHAAVLLSGTRVFPSPYAVWKGAADLERSGILLSYVGASLLRVATGFGAAVLVGVPLGSSIGLYAPLEAAVNPVIQVLRPISPLAWIPVSIAIFGIDSTAAISLIFLGSLFPVVVSSANAVRNVPAIYVQVGRNFGLSRPALLARVILPAALPQVLTGLRIAFGVAWLVVVAAEMVAVDSGLGYLIVDARNAGQRYDRVVAGMLLIGLIGLALDMLLRGVERLPSLRWGFRQDT
jgi:NitT/TauT family transport system permease protein